MRHVNILFLLAALAISVLGAKEAASSQSGIDIRYTLVFGPAPADLMSSQGRYMWVVSELENPSYTSVQAHVDLTVTGAPDGCWQIQQLILPGDPSFEFPARETRWALYRLRLECHSPADSGFYELAVNLCVGEEGQAPSECWTGARRLVTVWGGINLGLDVDARQKPKNVAADLGSLETCRPVKTGDTFDVDLYITEVEDLWAWAVHLNYDPAVVRVVDIDVWQFLATTPNPITLVKFFGDQMPDSDGTFGAVGIDLGPPGTGDSGTGVLARLTLEALAPGVSQLDLGQPQLLNEAGEYLDDRNGDTYFDGPVFHAKVAVDQDADGDGLATPCGDPVPEEPDADFDGVSDLVEVSIGSNPQDPSDTPEVSTECPEGSAAVYDEQGNFAGCFSVQEEVTICDPAGPDYDGDRLQDSCDPDPVN